LETTTLVRAGASGAGPALLASPGQNGAGARAARGEAVDMISLAPGTKMFLACRPAKGQGSHHPNARHGHQSPYRLVPLRLLADALIKHRLRLLDLFVHSKRAFNDRAQDVLVADDPKYMRAQPSADCPREQQADLLEQAADLVLEIASDADQASPWRRTRREPPGCRHS
jgi:hypothetical protein